VGGSLIFATDRLSHSLACIGHLRIAAVADTLAFTTDQMTRIDQAYVAAFPEGG